MARFFHNLLTRFLEQTAPATAPPITIASWVMPQLLGSDQTVMALAVGAGAASYDLYFDSTTLHARQTNGTSAEADIGTVQEDVWQHMAAVFAANDARHAYLNGSKGSDTTSVTGLTPDVLSFGRLSGSSPGQYLRGRLAETAVWAAALGDAEIAALARGASPLLVRPAALVMYRRLLRDEDVDWIGGTTLTVSANAPAIQIGPTVWGPPPPQVGYDQAHLPGQVYSRVEHSPVGLVKHAYDWIAGADGVAELWLDDRAAARLTGRLHRIVTAPGRPRPRTGWSVQLLDRLGLDVLQGLGGSRSATLVQQAHVVESLSDAHAGDLASLACLKFRISGAGRNGAGQCMIYTTPV